MTTSAVPRLALHITLRWRHDVIAFRRLLDEGVASVGTGQGALAPIPCTSDPAGFVVARVSGETANALAPDGATATVWRAGGRVDLIEGPASIALGEGDCAELSLGEFKLTTMAEVPEALPRSPRRRGGGAWGALAAAALAHAVVLGLAARDAMASIAEERDEERTGVLAGLLASAERRARADDTPIEDSAGTSEGRATNEKRGDGRAGGGERAGGEEGKMGDRLARPGEARRYAVPERVARDPEPSTACAEALADAAGFGMIGLLAQGPQVPVASFADAWAHGQDALAANGALWARLPGEAAGEAGLGLTGIGEGGGGDGEGIGLGRVGSLGHSDGRPGPGLGGEGSPSLMRGISGWGHPTGVGSVGIGVGRLSRGHRAGTPSIRMCGGGCNLAGVIPPEIVQRGVRLNFGRFRACYEAGLRQNPALEGRVTTRFVIGRDGGVASATDGGSSMPDAEVTACVVRAFYGLSFPPPEWGIVTVSYPVVFSPE